MLAANTLEPTSQDSTGVPPSRDAPAQTPSIPLATQAQPVEAEMILGCPRGDRQLRASGIARRRMEEKRVEAFFLCERRRQRRIPKRDARAAAVTS
jgi:hypothetical protein